MKNENLPVSSFDIPSKNTLRLEVRADALDTPSSRRNLERAAEVLRAGGTVAFPTETVYGLGANALDVSAVEGIFAAKQRPGWDPLIVHVSDFAMLYKVVSETGPRAKRLMQQFWPGPLTLLLPKTDAVPSIVTAGRALVGIRMPAHPVARSLIETTGLPLAAPSANRFGHASPTTAQHVIDDLDGRIDMVLDAGPTQCGVESTVVGFGVDETVIYRLGALSLENIESIIGPIRVYNPEGDPAEIRSHEPPESLPSPGVGIRHYAPKARMVAIDMGGDSDENRQKKWLDAMRQNSSNRSRLGIMLPRQWPVSENFSGVQYEWGSWGDDEELARRFFYGLRALDAMGAKIILCPLPTARGLGTALRDRILKATRRDEFRKSWDIPSPR